MLLYLLPFLFACIGISDANVIPRSQYIKGFDLCAPQYHLNHDFWICTRNAGYQKVIIRGFMEATETACGGFIDPNFVLAYEVARAVGYRPDQIDTYFFPCTNPTKCLPIQEQLDNFANFLEDKAIEINTIWFDIEPVDGSCDGWKLSGTDSDHKSNVDLALNWINAIDGDNKHKWGVYAPNTGNRWSLLFGSQDKNITSKLPLWVVQDTPAKEPDPSSYMPQIGGWQSVTGKQWKINTTADPCGGNVDLDSFIPSSIKIVANGPPDPPVQGYSCQTTADGLRYRLCNSTDPSCTVIGQYPIGTMVEFKCQVTSQQSIVGDWTTPLWGKTVDGYYVSLAYVYEPCATILPDCAV